MFVYAALPVSLYLALPVSVPTHWGKPERAHTDHSACGWFSVLIVNG